MADNAWLVGGIVFVLLAFLPLILDQFGLAISGALHLAAAVAFFAIYAIKSRKEAAA